MLCFIVAILAVLMDSCDLFCHVCQSCSGDFTVLLKCMCKIYRRKIAKENNTRTNRLHTLCSWENTRHNWANSQKVRDHRNTLCNDSFYIHGITLILAWIDDYIHWKMWHEIIHPFPNFNGGTVEYWEWISYFTPHFTGHVFMYPCLG